jgi:hypothetical protein
MRCSPIPYNREEGRWYSGARRQNAERWLSVPDDDWLGEMKLRAGTTLGGQGAVPIVGGGDVGRTSGEAMGERSSVGMHVAFPVEAMGERSDRWKDKIQSGERILRYTLCLCPMPFLHRALCDLLGHD